MFSANKLSALASVALLALALCAASAADARRAPKARSFSGTVASVAHDRRSFRISRTAHAGVLFRVGHGFKRSKGARLAKGQALDVRARRIKGHWVASRIAPSPASDDQGDDATADDGTADDPADDTSADDGTLDDPGDLLDPGVDPGDVLDPADP
jgi:hypothetical protein